MKTSSAGKSDFRRTLLRFSGYSLRYRGFIRKACVAMFKKARMESEMRRERVMKKEVRVVEWRRECVW